MEYREREDFDFASLYTDPYFDAHFEDVAFHRHHHYRRQMDLDEYSLACRYCLNSGLAAIAKYEYVVVKYEYVVAVEDPC